MRIGFYSPYLDTLGGGEKYMFTAASCLAENHDVSFFWDKTSASSLQDEVKDKFNLNLTHIRFTQNIFSPHISLTKRMKESKKYDVIIVLSDGSIPLVQTKLLLHFQSPITWVNKNSLKNRLKMKRVSKVFCNSLFTKKIIDAIYHCNSQVIYPPVEIFTKYKSPKENIILNVGRFGITTAGSSYKKQDVMMQAFKELIDEGLKDWQLVLVLSIKDKTQEKGIEQLQRVVKDYPISLVVNPNFATLWQLYGKAKLYWHAAGFGEDLTKYPDRAEHFGISTVEAMGMGAVPIVINAGGQKEIVTPDKNGMLWNTLDELKSETKEIIKNDDLLHKLSQQAIKESEKYSVHRFCEEIENLIR